MGIIPLRMIGLSQLGMFRNWPFWMLTKKFGHLVGLYLKEPLTIATGWLCLVDVIRYLRMAVTQPGFVYQIWWHLEAGFYPVWSGIGFSKFRSKIKIVSFWELAFFYSNFFQKVDNQKVDNKTVFYILKFRVKKKKFWCKKYKNFWMGKKKFL